MSSRSARQVALISWLLTGVSFLMQPALCLGERGFVVVQVQDLQGRPVVGVEIGAEGYGGSAITGNDGKARLSIGSAAVPGDPITLFVLRSPKGRDLAVFSPWNRTTPIPRFEDKPENYLTLVVINRGQRVALESNSFLSSAAANVISKSSKNNAHSNSVPVDPRVALEEVASEYGYSPAELDRAIRAWGKKAKDESATDPYNAAIAALYAHDLPTATRLLQESLTLRQEELAAARRKAAGNQEEAAERQRDIEEKKDKVANAAYFLGSSLYFQGRYEEAAGAYRQCLQVRPDDPFAINRVATSLQQAGDNKGAESLTDQALAIARQRYEPNDPALASALDTAGNVAGAIGNLSKAESLIQQAVDIDRRVQAGENHSSSTGNNLAASINDLGMVHQSQQKFAEAERDYGEAISINESLFGPGNLEGASYRNNLATLYENLHEYDKAEQEVLGVLALRQSLQGQDHPQVATELRILSEVYLGERRNREAETCARQALKIDEEFFKGNSQQVGLDLERIGGALLLERNYQSAENYLERSVNILRSAYGPESLEYGEALRELGNDYRHLGKNSEAEEQTLQSLEIYGRSLPPDYHWLAMSWEQMAYIYQQEHECSEQVAALKRALSIALKGLGPNHPTTKRIQSELNNPAC